GRSGTPMTVIFASSRLKAIPEMRASSIFVSSSNVISVPSPCSWKLESTRRRTLYLPANSTDLICRILEPSLAISSIPSNATCLGVRAVGENADLCPGVAARLDAALKQRHAQEADRDLLAGRHDDVELARIGFSLDLFGESDESVGFPAHCRNHDNELMAGGF